MSAATSGVKSLVSVFFSKDQSQAQRELWMMEDILTGLKINRDHFRFLLGLQRHHSKR